MDATGKALLQKSAELGRSGRVAGAGGVSETEREWAVLMGILWVTESTMRDRRRRSVTKRKREEAIGLRSEYVRLGRGEYGSSKRTSRDPGFGGTSSKRSRRSSTGLSFVLSGKVS